MKPGGRSKPSRPEAIRHLIELAVRCSEMLKLNVRRIPTWLSLGAALALMVTAANANTFTIDATWLNGPGTISGSFTMTPGDWTTIADVNVQASLPYTGPGQLVT